MRERDSEVIQMTDKQKRAIKFIEHELEITYNGKTDLEASNFIGRLLDKAKFCQTIERNMSIPVFSSKLGYAEPDLDLSRDLSKELAIRDMQHGKRADECMANFIENIFIENIER